LRETEISKQQILAAAEEVFIQRGYVGANMDEIAKITGMTKGAVFWHYGSKLGLFKAVLEKSVRRLREIYEHTFAQQGGILEKCQAMILGIQKDRAFKVLIQIGGLDNLRGVPKSTISTVRREVTPIFQDVIAKMKEAQNRGELKRNVDVLEILMTTVLIMAGLAQMERTQDLLATEFVLDGETAIRLAFEGLNSFKQ
jgi:AcrR family transcriptional regulator